MEALTWTGDGIEVRDAEAPALQGDGEALVRPVAVATCDLDFAMVVGDTPFPAPIALGHECVAEVVEIGDGVRGVQPGALVSVPFQISCGECEACRRGSDRATAARSRPSPCTGSAQAGSNWGGFLSDAVRVPYAEHMLVPLPAGLDPLAVASASDNIADAWRTVGPPLEREPGAAVLVMGGAGAGSIGLYAAAIAVALGSERVVYVDARRGPARDRRGLRRRGRRTARASGPGDSRSRSIRAVTPSS